MRTLKDEKIKEALRCPKCNTPMALREGTCTSLVCTCGKMHCYDFSSSGYVNMSPPMQSGGGDSKQAVRARTGFLELGHYAPVAEKLAELCCKYGNTGGLLIDAGCGEGYYSQQLAEAGFSVLGVDLSKFATDAAAKRFSKNGLDNGLFVTGSVFEIPIADNSADVITNVFAPCVQGEFSRALKPDGILAVAYAGENHLLGLKNAIYDTAHVNTQRADMPTELEKLDEVRVCYPIELNSNDDIMSLFAMTPYYWRTSLSDFEKLKGLERLTTEVDIIISVYKNN